VLPIPVVMFAKLVMVLLVSKRRYWPAVTPFPPAKLKSLMSRVSVAAVSVHEVSDTLSLLSEAPRSNCNAPVLAPLVAALMSRLPLPNTIVSVPTVEAAEPGDNCAPDASVTLVGVVVPVVIFPFPPSLAVFATVIAPALLVGLLIQRVPPFIEVVPEYVLVAFESVQLPESAFTIASFPPPEPLLRTVKSIALSPVFDPFNVSVVMLGPVDTPVIALN